MTPSVQKPSLKSLKEEIKSSQEPAFQNHLSSSVWYRQMWNAAICGALKARRSKVQEPCCEWMTMIMKELKLLFF
jgi:hypothetical protein